MTDFQYSSPGSPGAVDAGQIVVNAWRAGSTVEIRFKTASTLRALAVALQAHNAVLDLVRVGRQPRTDQGLAAADRLMRIPGVAAALTQTLTLSDAEDLRDALIDAVAELQATPESDWEDNR